MFRESTEEKRLVSVVIPCRNEGDYIAQCLDSVLVQDYPQERLEILVVDGMSEDKTREIIGQYQMKYPYIRLLDNHRGITPCAFNLGIGLAHGTIIVIIGAHSVYPNDYISKCVHYLEKYGADNVGGTMVTKPRQDTLTGSAIVAALSSPFGVGNSFFRVGSTQPRWTDTVFGGCYRRDVFDRIGLFNEKLIYSQDMEFNLRLKRAGGKILLVPNIASYYYSRSDFRSFIRHNFRNGKWVIYPLKFVKMSFKFRHYVPLFFVALLFVSALFALWFRSSLFLIVAGAYVVADLYFSWKIAIRKQDLRYGLLMPFVFVSIHLVYGVGSIAGLCGVLFSREFWTSRQG